ncbi:hypothetical protein [Amycolatopsis sp.]|jgi:hypothetical protein|uniref:hypothetical protein n=1 Tax=Amycolatopsis sp. TaxID=37632 RepID=UPI002E05A210|nr:hypothetical protein [Amycolatopsis sp.]
MSLNQMTPDSGGDYHGRDFAVTDRRHSVVGLRVSVVAPEVDTGAQALTRAAIAALNRRDQLFSIRAATTLAAEQRSAASAVALLTDILLKGFPRGALRPGVRLDVDFKPTPDDPDCPKAQSIARDVLTAAAAGDDAFVTRTLQTLPVETIGDVLVVLLYSAAGRLEHFAGVDGDAADAYYDATAANTDAPLEG